MCTLIIATRAWHATPLLVAANRDEDLSRPSLPPHRWLGDNIVAPRDVKAGGTWLGLSHSELFVGITNRFSGEPPKPRRSRGEIVTKALQFTNADDSFAVMKALNPTEYNGFHLVLADRTNAYLIWSDGQSIRANELQSGLHIITERSFNAAPSLRQERLDQWAETAQQKTQAPTDNNLSSVLSHHEATPFESTCVHWERAHYGTRSAAIIRLGDSVDKTQFSFADGPPCTAPFLNITNG